MTADVKSVMVEDLLATRLFAGEERDAVTWLLESCEVMDMATGEMLFEPGQKNDSLYLVLSGQLAVKLTNGSDELLDYVPQGSCVGEMSVLEGQPVSAYVYADQPTRLLAIKDTYMWSLINRSGVVARNLLLLLSARIRKGHKIISESLQAQRTSEQDAKIDSLTGLYNRRWLNEALPRWAGRKEKLSVMMLDIDHFKQYNDSQGHLAGDTALNSVANTLMQQLRPTDLAARYGGEEFVALLPDASFEEAKEVAERVRNAIRTQEIIDGRSQSLPGVTISIGIAELEEGQDGTGLLSKADAALYRAKNNGRDRVSE